MIGRLFQTLSATVLYFCLATVIAEGILVFHFWGKWQMDHTKLVQMIGIAQGVDPLAMHPKAAEGHEQTTNEQPSYEQVLAAQAAKDLNLRLREQSLANSLAALESDQQNLAQSVQQYTQQRQQYETQLEALENEATVAGRDVNLRTLQSLKPKQAKELIVHMLQNNEQDAVVLLLRDMSDSKRAKIIGEFKTPEECAKIDDILRLIRNGAPEAIVANGAAKQLGAEQSVPP